MKLQNIFWYLLGGAMIGGACIVFALFSLTNLVFSDFITNHYLLFGLFCCAPFIAGIVILRKNYQNVCKQKQHSLEVNIMKFAAKDSAGKISVADISMKFKQPVMRVENIMKQLQERGVFDVQVSLEGVLLYRLNTAEEKNKMFASEV